MTRPTLRGIEASAPAAETESVPLLLLAVLASAGASPAPQPGAASWPATPAPPALRRDAHGVVTRLSAGSVTVGRLTCSIAAAPDSRAAAATLSLGAVARIDCRPAGGRWVLAAASTG